jgi:GxxExxY protein
LNLDLWDYWITSIAECNNQGIKSIKKISVQTNNYLDYKLKIEKMKEQDLTHKIIGAAMEVHRYLGNGFQEVIYQRALAIEMQLQNILYSREQEIPLQYKGIGIGTRRVDFFVDGKIMVEIKAVINLEDVHLAQAMNYVEAYNLEIGLLINFGAKSLQFKRVHNNNKKS